MISRSRSGEPRRGRAGQLVTWCRVAPSCLEAPSGKAMSYRRALRITGLVVDPDQVPHLSTRLVHWS
jgi:hypothetical protein